MPDVLLATPDFPPMGGGIQLLLARLVEHASWRTTVVCFDDAGADDAGPDVVRVPRLADHRLSVLALGRRTVLEARRRRPDAVLAGHLVLGPAALLGAQAAGGAAAVQVLYAMEVGARAGLARRVLGRMDAVVTISEHGRAVALAHGAAAARTHVVLPGSDAAAPAPRGPREPVVVTVARLEDRYKGFDVLLRAFPLVRAQVPEARWVLVGEGGLRAELTATARAWGVPVEFAGALDDAERDAVLRRAAVFAMPSRVSGGGEGFGIVYLEAGAAGLPVVAGAEGGATSAVLDGETGLLVDPRDHVAVASALVRLLRDPELAGRLGRAGAARQRELSWERMAHGFEAVVAGAV